MAASSERKSKPVDRRTPRPSDRARDRRVHAAISFGLILTLLAAVLLNFAETGTTAEQTQQVTISGVVVDDKGKPMSDIPIMIDGTRRTGTLTGREGAYAVPVTVGGSYTLTPYRADAVFRPASLTFPKVSGDVTGANFVGTFSGTFTVSGAVVDSTGRGVVDIVISVSGTPPILTLTGRSGGYSLGLAAGGSYTLTPSKKGSTFDPPSFTIAKLNRDYSGISFVQIPQNKVRISGIVSDSSGQPLGDVILGLGGTDTALSTTGSSGAYAFTVASGGSYTVTPARGGYTFNPPTYAFNNLTQSQTSANFAGMLAPIFSISGSVTEGFGMPMVDATVLLSGPSSALTLTGAAGNYSFSGVGPGSYVVTPAREGFAFSPPSRLFANLSSDQINVSFVGVPAGTPGTDVSPGITPSPTPSARPTPSPSPMAPTPTQTPTPFPSPSASAAARSGPTEAKPPATKTPEPSTTSVFPKTPKTQKAAVVSRKRRVKSRSRRPTRRAKRSRTTQKAAVVSHKGRVKSRSRPPTRRAKRSGEGKRSSKGAVKRLTGKTRNKKRRT